MQNNGGSRNVPPSEERPAVATKVQGTAEIHRTRGQSYRRREPENREYVTLKLGLSRGGSAHIMKFPYLHSWTSL